MTGSRAWRDQDRLWGALHDQYREYGPLVIINGRCPEGADQMAHQWYLWYEDECVEESYFADWRPQGKSGPTDRGAGFRRNQKMVDAGADICLAFPTICHKNLKSCPDEPHYSHGTADCMRRAERAGIPVENYGADLTGQRQ